MSHPELVPVSPAPAERPPSVSPFTGEDRWRLLSEVGRAASGILDPEELLRELARLLVTEMADYCVTYVLEDDRVRRVGVAHADPASEPLLHRLFEVATPTLRDAYGAGAAIRTGEPILAPEITPVLLQRVTSDEEHLRAILALGPRSSMILPLRARGRVAGAIALATTDRSGRRYDDRDLALGREIADRAALALDNARLYGELRDELGRRRSAEDGLRRRYEQIRVLYEMTEAVGRAAGVEDVYEQALEGLRHGLQVGRASILLFDPDGVMRFKAWRGISDGYRRAVEGHTPWGPDAVDPQPIVIPDIAADPHLEEELRATILGEGIRGAAFIPLVFGGRLLGKFMLYFDAPRSLAEDELELARGIASTIAFAIRRMRDEISVREAKEAAERANEAKSQFLGVMSHELRTPLNAVLGYAELLLLETKGAINEVQREQLERIQASARHQLGLVDELLTYTRLEAGREEPRFMPTDVRRVVMDVGELVRPEAERKGLSLRVEVPDAPLLLLTDPGKLRQIVLNLAGNATKYTESGEVVIRTCVRPGEVRVEVQDSGPGIAADKLDYIFEPFTRVEEGLTRATAGTGLGLAIARRLAHLLDGTLDVRSRPGKGSTFGLSLPDRPPPSGGEDLAEL